MSLGSLKSFFLDVQAAPTLAGINVVFGEENRFAQEYSLPYIVIVPRGGRFAKGKGYIKDAGQTYPIIWTCVETIDIEIWSASTDPAALNIDNVDAVENAQGLVLQALYAQQTTGLSFAPSVNNWATMEDATTGRYGRALVLSVLVEISIPGPAVQTATVTGIVITDSINGEPATS